MNEVIVIDDVITKDYQKYVLQIINDNDFPLFFKANIVADKYNLRGNVHGFCHQLFEDQNSVSKFFPTLYPIALSITEKTGVKFQALDRMRINFVVGNPDSQLDYHMPHIDSFIPHYVAIYYINDCDGDTVIFDQKLDRMTVEEDERIVSENMWTIKQRVSPKMGRMVIFDGRHYHASSYTKTKPFRSVINMNLAKYV